MAISFAIGLINFALGVKFLPTGSEYLRVFPFKLCFLVLEFMFCPFQIIDALNNYIKKQLSGQKYHSSPYH